MAMNGLLKMAATAFLIVMVMVPAAVAVTYKVGDTDQWSSGVDYTVWATGKTFRVGDILEFIYGPSHTVSVVDKAGYDACDGSSTSDSFAGGNTKIELKTEGAKYYLCPTPGHCQSGMKLTVTVLAAGTPQVPSPPPSSSPGTPSTPADSPEAESPPADSTPPAAPVKPTTPTSSPPPKGNGASKGVMSYVLVGVSMVLGYGLWV